MSYTQLAVHLRKYYLDMVTSDGRAFVWHWASLRWPFSRWGPVRLRLASEIAWHQADRRESPPELPRERRDQTREQEVQTRPEDSGISRRTARAGSEPWIEDLASDDPDPHGPERHGHSLERSRSASGIDIPSPDPAGGRLSLRWVCPALGIDGRWRQRVAGPTLELLPERPGAVRWDCLQAASDVEVVRNGQRLSGRGYAERLDLALPPWRLPIDVLRWGRMTTDGHSAVWISWDGPRPQRILLVNGGQVPSAEVDRIDEAGVRWSRGRISLNSAAPILDQPLSHVLRGGARWLRGVLPDRLLEARERRWLSPATLQGAGPPEAPVWHGLAMHECVRFGCSA